MKCADVNLCNDMKSHSISESKFEMKTDFLTNKSVLCQRIFIDVVFLEITEHIIVGLLLQKSHFARARISAQRTYISIYSILYLS